MDMVFKTDVSGWMLKSKKIRRAVWVEAAQGLRVIAKALYTRAQVNLKGPHYSPPKYKGPRTGEMPIPRVTGSLARSLKMRKMMEVLWKVFSDSSVAAYNKYVHDGTKRNRPRRFLMDTVRVNRPAWLKYLSRRIRKGIDRAQGAGGIGQRA